MKFIQISIIFLNLIFSGALSLKGMNIDLFGQDPQYQLLVEGDEEIGPFAALVLSQSGILKTLTQDIKSSGDPIPVYKIDQETMLTLLSYMEYIDAQKKELIHPWEIINGYGQEPDQEGLINKISKNFNRDNKKGAILINHLIAADYLDIPLVCEAMYRFLCQQIDIIYSSQSYEEFLKKQGDLEHLINDALRAYKIIYRKDISNVSFKMIKNWLFLPDDFDSKNFDMKSYIGELINAKKFDYLQEILDVLSFYEISFSKAKKAYKALWSCALDIVKYNSQEQILEILPKKICSFVMAVCLHYVHEHKTDLNHIPCYHLYENFFSIFCKNPLESTKLFSQEYLKYLLPLLPLLESMLRPGGTTQGTEYLNLQKCGLTEIPGEICLVEKLVYLDCAGNNLTTLPLQLERLRYLENIYVSMSRFFLPPNECLGKKIQYL